MLTLDCGNFVARSAKITIKKEAGVCKEVGECLDTYFETEGNNDFPNL